MSDVQANCEQNRRLQLTGHDPLPTMHLPLRNVYLS